MREADGKFSNNFVDRIYSIKLEIKDTTDTNRSASFFDLHLEINSEGQLRTKLYDKRDDSNFAIVNCPFTCSNIWSREKGQTTIYKPYT
jgi:predicted RND superfamily exporter protein